MSTKLTLGSVVLYKSDLWLAVAYDGVSKLTLMQPHRGNAKRVIHPKNVVNVGKKKGAVLVTVNDLPNQQLGKDYLLTHGGIVVSKQTLKVINDRDIINRVKAASVL